MDSITPCSLLLLSTHVTSATSTSMEPGALDFARFFFGMNNNKHGVMEGAYTIYIYIGSSTWIIILD